MSTKSAPSRSIETTSASPMKSPPAMAPQMLPMPPTTIAEIPLSPSASPMKGWHLAIVQRKQDAAQRGERAADEKDHRDDAVDVHAEEERGIGVLGNSAQRASKPGPGED